MIKPIKELVSIYSTDMKDWRFGTYGLEDSFELGIKVGDEWRFEGDMVYKESLSEDDPAVGCYGMEGTIVYRDGILGIIWDDEIVYGEPYPSPLIYHVGLIKFIGNIHEVKNENT